MLGISAERPSHIPPEYLGTIEALIQEQLELLALAAKASFRSRQQTTADA